MENIRGDRVRGRSRGRGRSRARARAGGSASWGRPQSARALDFA